MVPSLSLTIALLLASLGVVAQGPFRTAQRSMYETISTMPSDAAKDGPLVAPVPLRMAAGASLDDLNRRKAVVRETGGPPRALAPAGRDSASSPLGDGALLPRH